MAIIYGDQNPANPNDSLRGTDDADEIYGLTGNDTLIGGAGADTLFGGDGDDVFILTPDFLGEDSVDGGDGVDTIRLSSATSDQPVTLIIPASLAVERIQISGGVQFSNQDDIVDLSNARTVVYSYGTAYPETLNPGTVTLLGGNDVFIGNGASDRVSGGAGNDSLSGDLGDDSLYGRDGADTLSGGDGDDRLYGEGGPDTLIGGDGDDLLDATDPNGLFLGGAGYDTLVVGGTSTGLVLDAAASIEVLSATLIQGTDAANLFDVSGVISTGAQFLGGGGDDTLLGGLAGNRFNGELGSDLLEGGGGNDTLTGGGGGGVDTLRGGDGNDLLILTGGEVFDAGAGTDTARVEGFSANLSFVGTSIELATLVTSATGLGQANAIDLSAVQTVTLGVNFSLKEGDDVFVGSDAAERLLGGTGDDTLSGLGGADTLIGEDGDDRLTGDLGNDALYGGIGADRIDGGEDADLLDGGAGDDSVIGGTGNDTLVGGGGSDTLNGGVGDDLFRVSGTGAAKLIGGEGADRLDIVGAASLARLILDAAASVETVDLNGQPLRGSAGDDVFDMTGVVSYVDGNSFALGVGDDRFRGGAQAESVDGGGGNDRLDGGAGFDTLSGGGGADTLVGSGLDSLIGGGGNDIYLTGAASDVIFEQASGGGRDEIRTTVTRVLDANVEVLKLAGRDAIDGTGNDGNNVIVGNAAANALAGGLGTDVLTGGGGADEFVFDARLGRGNVDRVTDFGRGGDTLLLDIAIFADIDAGRLDRNAFVIGRAAEDANDRIIYNDVSGKLFYDRDGSGGAKAVEFARLDGAPDLTHRDIIVG